MPLSDEAREAIAEHIAIVRADRFHKIISERYAPPPDPDPAGGDGAPPKRTPKSKADPKGGKPDPKAPPEGEEPPKRGRWGLYADE